MFRYNHYITSSHLKRAQSVIAPLLNINKYKVNVQRTLQRISPFWAGQNVLDINKEKAWEKVDGIISGMSTTLLNGYKKNLSSSKTNTLSLNIPSLKQKPFLSNSLTSKGDIVVGKRYYSSSNRGSDLFEHMIECLIVSAGFLIMCMGIVCMITFALYLIETGSPFLGWGVLWLLIASVLFFSF